MTTSLAARPIPGPAERSDAPNQWLILGTISLGYCVASLGMAPVASILPTVTADFGVGVAAAGWMMTSYFLMLVGTVLIMGRLGDVFGHARVFGLGTAAFSAAQILCGLAPSFPLLLIARAAQGIGSAMILGTSLAIIAAAGPARSRGRSIGVLTMSASASSLLGVGLSTWCVQNLSWHWSFLLTAPLGLVAALLSTRLRLVRPRMASAQVDWLGGLLLFGTITAAMLGLNHLHEGPETFEEGAGYHLGMHLLALGLFAAFIKVEQRAAAPLLGFRLLRNQDFSSGMVGNGIAHMSMLATTFLLPFLLERGRGLTPADTRTLLMWQQVAMVVCAVGLGYVYDRTRSPLVGIGLLGCIAVGLVTYGFIGGSLPFMVLLGIAIMLGGGLGGFTTVNNTQIMELAPQDQRGFASGLVELTRQFGHAVGVSLSSSFMGAALVGIAAPSTEHYVAGFQQAAFAMGVMSSLGIVALVWALVGSRGRSPVPSLTGARAVSSAGLVRTNGSLAERRP